MGCSPLVNAAPAGRTAGLAPYVSIPQMCASAGMGRRYAQVSEVLNLLAKPGLINWAVQMAARALLEGSGDFYLLGHQDAEAALQFGSGRFLRPA